MRQIKDKGIAKLYAAALRAKKAKHTKKRAAPKRGKVTRRKAKRRGSPQAKVATVMREFYAGGLTTHGRKVPRGRPDIAKVLRTAAATARKPKRRVVKRTAKRRSSPQARSRPQVDHRVIRHAARKAPRKRTEAERTALAHASSRSWASGRMAKRIKKVRSKGSKKPSPAQLAARKKFVEMVRARSKAAKHDKKGPNRRGR